MKFKPVFILVFSCISLFANAQTQSFNEYYGIFMEGYTNKDLSKMKEGSELLMKNMPDEFAGYYVNSFYQICSENIDKARTAANKALSIEPFSPYPYTVLSYINLIENEIDLAQKNMNYAVQLRSHENFKDLYKDFDLIEYFTKKDFTPIKKALTEFSNQGLMNPDLALKFDQCFIGTMKGTPCNSIDELAAKFNAMKVPNPIINKMFPLVKAIKFNSNGNIAESKKQFETFLSNSKGEPSLYWQRSYAYWFLSTIKKDSFDERGALLNINSALEEYKNLGFNSYQLANMQLHKIHVLKDLGDKQQEKLQTAFELEQTANALNNDYYRAKAYNSIGAYYLMDGPRAELAKGADYLTKAFHIAKNVNDIPLIREVNANYIIIKARQGLFNEVDKITEETAQGYLKDKLYDQAQNLYNNLGFIYFNRKDYKNAIIHFEKSFALAEFVKSNLNAKQKLAYMNDVAGAYTGLAMSYKYSGETEKLFEMQEFGRSGYLKDMLGSNGSTTTLQEAQKLLKADEILLTYTIGRPGEIIITAITKTKAEIRYNYPIEELLRFKKTYTDRVKKIPAQLNPYMSDLNVDYSDGQLVRFATKEAAYKKEDFVLFVEWTRQLLESSKPELRNTQKDFLRFWHNLTLEPVQDLLSQYPKVIISSSSELNYLPFEAFINPNNQYFIEKHNIRYIPSTTIWKIIADRVYQDNRKSVIAFGGAHFQPSGNVSPSVRGIEDFYKVSDAVTKKIEQGVFNFKPELEALGFGGASYLMGTLAEVEFVGSLSNDAKVLSGHEMTESTFKRLNDSGELKQYKNLLISTHGFTGDIIPEFSGVMFSQPNEGDENEDTFLLAPEIAKLNLNADMVVLSACDTGLGKLYGGEGINGLNTAFLIAGSNATLLSLWPVDDAGTALTMQNLFKNVIQRKANTLETLSQIKRAFIKGEFGEEYKQPQYWAPFLYNGK